VAAAAVEVTGMAMTLSANWYFVKATQVVVAITGGMPIHYCRT